MRCCSSAVSFVSAADSAGRRIRAGGGRRSYAFASTAELSLFRRPLPVTNLKFHTTPNVGGSSTGAFFEGASRAGSGASLYTLRCSRGLMAGQTLRTNDPGWGLVTGGCLDIGRFKVPALRGLAGRAPYFHDGSAATLDDVVAAYDRRFDIGLTPADKADLGAFLRAL